MSNNPGHLGCSSCASEIPPFFAATYNQETIAIRRTEDYDSTVNSVQTIFPALAKVTPSRVCLSAQFEHYGGLLIQIKRDLWAEVVHSVKVVEVSIRDEKPKKVWNLDVKAPIAAGEGVAPIHPYTFNTTQVHPFNKPQTHTSIEIPIRFGNTSFPMGITLLDIHRDSNIRINAFADSLSKDGTKAKVHLDSWLNTTVFSAGSTWLDVSKDDPNFQFGTFSAGRLCRNASSIDIKFDRPYPSPPRVVVWLKELDICHSRNWRVKAVAENVTTTGFVLSVASWHDTILFKATAWWIAYPGTHPNITSGSFNTTDIRPWNQPRQDNGRYIQFDKKFDRIPRILVALNVLDIGNSANLRIKVLTKDVTAQGMTLNINSWLNTTLYSAGVSYLAIQDS